MRLTEAVERDAAVVEYGLVLKFMAKPAMQLLFVVAEGANFASVAAELVDRIRGERLDELLASGTVSIHQQDSLPRDIAPGRPVRCLLATPSLIIQLAPVLTIVH